MRDGEMIRKNIRIIILFLFITSLINLMIVSCNESKSASSETENTNSFEIERLMGELGIIQVPHIAPPVDFSLFDLKSKKITLSDLIGKDCILKFLDDMVLGMPGGNAFDARII